jgi:hypothetical protein
MTQSRVDQVSQLVREEAHSVSAIRRWHTDGGPIPLKTVFGHRSGNRVVEAPVEHAEIRGAERRVSLNRQLGDRLTDITIVVHDLRHGESLLEKLAAVLDRALRDRWVRSEAEAQYVHQLIEEQRHSIDLGFISNRQPRRHFRMAARNDLLAMRNNEIVKHRLFSVGSRSAGHETSSWKTS